MIGVAGCGRMGLPMLQALVAAGARAQGFDVAPIADAHVTGDIKAFASDITTLISVVRDEAQTDDVLFGAQNLVAAAPRLDRIIISSTLSPNYTRALRARVPDHIGLIDAPMSGAAIAAQNAALTFMVGGTTEEIDALEPIFFAMGKTLHRMGAFGAGMQAKVLNNLLAASHTAMTRLVLDWSRKTGLDQAALLEVIATSSGQNWFASGFDAIEFARDGYATDNSIGILVKDVAAALDAAPAQSDPTLPQVVLDTLSTLKPLP